MPILADAYDLLVGVDTHAATHTYAIIDAATGALLDGGEFPPAKPGSAALWPGSPAAPKDQS